MCRKSRAEVGRVRKAILKLISIKEPVSNMDQNLEKIF